MISHHFIIAIASTVSCNVRSICHPYAQCIYQAGEAEGFYVCQCNEGYEGDGFECRKTGRKFFEASENTLKSRLALEQNVTSRLRCTHFFHRGVLLRSWHLWSQRSLSTSWTYRSEVSLQSWIRGWWIHVLANWCLNLDFSLNLIIEFSQKFISINLSRWMQCPRRLWR